MSFLSDSDLTRLQTAKYANLGSLAILIFDYCITFSEEVRWTWFKPWDVTRIVFVISRYLPFAGVGMDAYEALRVSNQCPSTSDGYIIDIISIIAAEVLLVIRTWAFWQKSKRLLIGIVIYSVLTIAAAVVVDRFPTMLIPGEEPPPGTCYFENTRNSAIVYMLLAMFESVMLILTVYKRVHDYNDSQSGIVVTIYHGGMLYMTCILTVTLVNVIVVTALPSAYSRLFDTLQLVSHSVLASRILFHLRHSTRGVDEQSMSLTLLDTVNYLQPSSISTNQTLTTVYDV